MNSAIIYEDDSIIIVHKPAGIATQTARVGQADVVSELRNYRSKKKEDTYIGVIHRLDQPVEGLLVFGKNAKVSNILSSDVQKGVLKKSYHALVQYEGQSEDASLENEVTLTDYLIKDGRTNLSRVVPKEMQDAKRAELAYKIEKVFPDGYALARIEIMTGRHHQIRVQMSNANMPLLGDGKYGNDRSKDISNGLGIRNTALLADRLVIKHPKTGEKLEFTIPFPKEWEIG